MFYYKQPKHQSGAALLAFMLIMITGASYLLVNKLNTYSSFERNTSTQANLNEAKKALLSYAMNYPELRSSTEKGPGFLPCPDRHDLNDPLFGNPSSNCAAATGTTLGRLPHQILGLRDIRESGGELLWYAVSDNFKNTLPNDTVINSETPGLITVDGEDDIVAVVIAPGEPVDGQNNRPSLDMWDYLEDANADFDLTAFTTNGANEFNDQLVTITRQELMEAIEQRVINEMRAILDNYRETYGAYPWLTTFADPQAGNPSVSGTATAGSAGVVLVDNAQDFITAGIKAGDVVVNESDGSIGRVQLINDSTTLTLDRLDFGSNNSFSSADTYTIPRFNGTEGVTSGLLPYHENNELFRTGFQVAWLANDATVNVDAVTPAAYSTSISTSISTSEGTVSEEITVANNSGSCVWTSEANTDCKGYYTDNSFLSGTVTTGSGAADGSGRLNLIDGTMQFLSAGISRGDLVLNYSLPASVATSGTAEAGTGNTTLVDTTKDFSGLGIAPRTYVVKVISGTDESLYIVKSVAGNTLELVTLPDQLPLLAEGVDYSVYSVTQGIVDTVISDTSIRVRTIDGAPALTFNEKDTYRILFAVDEFSNYADIFTDINNFIVYENSISSFDTEDVQPGDTVENLTYGGIGTITATGADAGGAWFTYTALKGGTFPDIFYNERYRIHHTHVDERRYDFELQYAGNVEVPTVADDPLTEGKKRSVCIGYGDDCAGTSPTTETLPENASNPSVVIRDYDINSNLIARADLYIDASTTGRVRLADIQYDFIESDTELPFWYVKNDWHKLIYISYSEGFAPGANDNCTAGTDCLTLTMHKPYGVETVQDKQAIVLAAGKQLPAQDRTTGLLASYYENENAVENSSFEKNNVSDLFNDQISVVAP